MKNDALRMALDKLKMKIGAHQDAKMQRFVASKQPVAPAPTESTAGAAPVEADNESELLALLEQDTKRR